MTNGVVFHEAFWAAIASFSPVIYLAAIVGIERIAHARRDRVASLTYAFKRNIFLGTVLPFTTLPIALYSLASGEDILSSNNDGMGLALAGGLTVLSLVACSLLAIDSQALGEGNSSTSS